MIKNLLCASVLMMFAGVNAQTTTTVFQEDFEDSASVGTWSILDRDGDGENWEILNAELNELTTFTGNFAISFSWYWDAFTPDNILVSPSISIPATGTSTLTFKVAAGDDDLYDEKYAVYAIPANAGFTGTETPIFTEVLDAGYVDAAKIITVDVSQFKGQDVKLVFRHYDCTDIFYIGIDDVKIENGELAVSDVSKVKTMVYPNPTSDVVKVSGLDKVEKIRVFDMQGKMVSEVAATEVNISHLPKGQYLLNIYSGSDVVTKSVIKK